LSLCPRTHSLRRGDQDMLVYCFAQRQHAKQFRERFGGELIDPKSRPKRTAARKSACAHEIDVRESAASAKHQRTLYPASLSSASVLIALRSSFASTYSAAPAAAAWPISTSRHGNYRENSSSPATHFSHILRDA